ncbi:MAG: hypothetical protein V9H25_09630 [Candidatus Competibacter sp.]
MHFPYIVVLSIIGRFILFCTFELELKEPIPTKLSEIIFAQAKFLVGGILDAIIIAIIIEVYIWFTYSMSALRKNETIGRVIRLIYLGSVVNNYRQPDLLSNINFWVPTWVIFFVLLVVFGIIANKLTNTKSVINSFWTYQRISHLRLLLELTFGIIDGFRI